METSSRQICEDFIMLMGRTKACVFALAADLGLTPVQMFALYSISKGEDKMGHIAQALHCDASNVTGIVDRLVSAGLVIRQEDVKDRRARTIQLTKSGQETVELVFSKMPEYMGCDKLTADERNALHSAIHKIS
jgi:DNA-binding MarR family transcriptional regulator